MGFLDFLFGRSAAAVGPFRTAPQYETNRAKQVALAPQALAHLRAHGVGDTAQMPLQYFFYTNAPAKAKQLAAALDARGYGAEHERSAWERREYVIQGWTTPMLMNEQTIIQCITELCALGRQHDCALDSWTTDVQEDG